MICSICGLWEIKDKEDRYCSGCRAELMSIREHPPDGEVLPIFRGKNNTSFRIENAGIVPVSVQNIKAERFTPKDGRFPIEIPKGEFRDISVEFEGRLETGATGTLTVSTTLKDIAYDLNVVEPPELSLFVGNELCLPNEETVVYYPDDQRVVEGRMEISSFADTIENFYSEDQSSSVELSQPEDMRVTRSKPSKFYISLASGAETSEQFKIILESQLLGQRIMQVRLERHTGPKPVSQLLDYLSDRDAIIFGSKLERSIEVKLSNQGGSAMEIVDLVPTAPWISPADKRQILGSILDIGSEITLEIKIVPENITEQTLETADSRDQLLLYLLRGEGLELTHRDITTGRENTYPIPIEIGVRKPEPLIQPLVIDFGTTNTCAGFIPNNSVDRIVATLDQSKDGQPTSEMPSCMRFINYSEVFPIIDFGQTAFGTWLTTSLDTFKATAYGWKQQLADNTPQTYWDGLGYARSYTPVELTSIYLRRIIEIFESRFPFKVQQILLTYPAVFRMQKDKLIQAVEEIGYDRDDIIVKISEPEAFALGYIYRHPEEFDDMAEDDERIFGVLDFGGGTVDITIARIIMENGSKRITVLLSDGVVARGGDYLTFLLAKRLYALTLDEIRDKLGVEEPARKFLFPLEQYGAARIAWNDTLRENYRVLIHAAENLKSRYDEFDESLEDGSDKKLKVPIPELFSVDESQQSISGTDGIEVSVSRSDFEDVVTNAIMESTEKLNGMIEELFDSEEMSSPTLDTLILAGNGSKLKLVETLAQKEALVAGEQGQKNVKVDYESLKTGVARGGLMYTGTGMDITFEGIERLMYSIGYDSGGGRFREAFPRRTILDSPESKPIAHLTPKFRVEHFPWFSIYMNKSLEKAPRIFDNPEIERIADIPIPIKERGLAGRDIVIQIEIPKDDHTRLDYSIFLADEENEDRFDLVGRGSVRLRKIL